MHIVTIRVSDPVFGQKTGFGALYLEQREILKNQLDEFMIWNPFICFHTFGVRHSIDVLVSDILIIRYSISTILKISLRLSYRSLDLDLAENWLLKSKWNIWQVKSQYVEHWKSARLLKCDFSVTLDRPHFCLHIFIYI